MVFYDFIITFGTILELLGDPRWGDYLFRLFVVPGVPPWTVLGSLLAPLLNHFRTTFEVVWVFFSDVSESWFEVGFLVVSIWNVVEAAPQARPKTT